MAYTQLLYHIIFRTKGSVPSINFENERTMYHYIYSTSRNLGCIIHRIGGMPDHIHILVGLPADMPPSIYVEKIKVSTSKKFKGSELFPLFTGWATGYAALTYSYRDKDLITNYIIRQKKHHLTIAFSLELRNLLLENGVEINEDYFLKD
ncbi:MAG: transposase [Bacteroidales bacterium]|nr:transposase [Bacteroidales bacterium]